MTQGTEINVTSTLAWFLHFTLGSTLRDSELEKLRSLLWASSKGTCWEQPVWAGWLAAAREGEGACNAGTGRCLRVWPGLGYLGYWASVAEGEALGMSRADRGQSRGLDSLQRGHRPRQPSSRLPRKCGLMPLGGALPVAHMAGQPLPSPSPSPITQRQVLAQQCNQ